jgi:hypothetical protein
MDVLLLLKVYYLASHLTSKHHPKKKRVLNIFNFRRMAKVLTIGNGKETGITGMRNVISMTIQNQYNAAGGVGAGLIARDVVTGSTTNGNTTEKSILISN